MLPPTHLGAASLPGSGPAVRQDGPAPGAVHPEGGAPPSPSGSTWPAGLGALALALLPACAPGQPTAEQALAFTSAAVLLIVFLSLIVIAVAAIAAHRTLTAQLAQTREQYLPRAEFRAEMQQLSADLRDETRLTRAEITGVRTDAQAARDQVIELRAELRAFVQGLGGTPR